VDRTLDMVGQFLLGKAEVPALANWPKQQIGEWVLHWHPRLPTTEIRSQNGTQVGWLMGLAIDTNGEPVGPVWRLPFDCERADAVAQFESELTALGGRFAAAFLSSLSDRFYLDASGSLAAVYCKDYPVIASTCNLIPQTKDLRQNLALVQAIGLPRRVGYFPFGLTPWPGVARLLPSHYLDLRQWTAKRHWPTGPRFDSTQHPEETVREIAALIEGFISGVAKLAPIQLALTGGHDSRVLLACSRPSLPSIRCITTRLPNINARIDCAYGRRIADRFGLDYSVLTWKEASQAEIETWLYRTGACVVDTITSCTRTDDQLDPARVTLLGIGGEVGQGYYWRPGDLPANPISSEELIRRRRFPALDVILQAASDWLNHLPATDLLEKLDLFFLEQRLGCWAGPAMYGTTQARFVAYPHNSRRIYEKMLSMPQDYRREARMPMDLMRLKWPELLEIPFNEPFGFLKLEYKTRQTLEKVRSAIGSRARRVKSTLVGTSKSG
jgi:hypothetical protein